MRLVCQMKKSVGALRCSDIIVAVPPSCSSVFLYKHSHFSVFFMQIQYYFYKDNIYEINSFTYA